MAKRFRLAVFAFALAALLVNGALAGTLARLYLEPGHVTLRPGAVQEFVVYGTDVFDNSVPVDQPVTWSSTAGTITQDGVFTAGQAIGSFLQGVTVTAQNGVKGTAVITVCSPPPSGGYAFERSWGDFVPSHLLCPSAIGVGLNATVLVADRGGESIQIYDSGGQWLGVIGPRLPAGIRLNGVSAVASYGSHIYVAQNQSIYKLDTQGTLVATWSGFWGPGDGQSHFIKSMAFDKTGFLYLLDSLNSRVVMLSSSGFRMLSFGSAGSGDGQSSYPKSICVGADDLIYVADYGNCRVQKFTAYGQFAGKWTVYNNGRESQPTMVASDAQSSIYLTDNTYSILKTNPTGVPIVRLETPVPVDGVMNACVDAFGNIYSATDESQIIRFGDPALSDAAAELTGTVCVRKFGSTGNFLAEWGKSRAGTLYRPGGVAVGPDNLVYVADTRGGRVQVFHADGSVSGSWRPALGEPGYLRFDHQGFLYTTDWMGAGKYTRAGTSLKHFDVPFPSVIPPDTLGVAVAPGGDVFISQMGKNTITRLNAAGEVVAEWDSPGTGPGQFLGPTGLSSDCGGNLYVADRENGRVQKLDANGQYLGQWPAGGSSSHTVGVSLGSDGSVFAVNFHPGNVVKYSVGGPLLGQWGSAGREPDQFFEPMDIAVDAVGNFYVADQGNNRICKYMALHESVFTAKSLNDGGLAALKGQVVTAGSDEMGGGAIYVQSPDHSGGIRVEGVTAARGTVLSVVGVVNTVDGERVIRASNSTGLGSADAAPVAMTNKSLGGADLNFDPTTGAGQRGVEDGQGANNVGLLVITTGRVTGAGEGFFYLDDGTHVRDASGWLGVRVISRSFDRPAEGTYVSVTGISRIHRIGDSYCRAVAPRSASDIRVVN